MRAELANTRSLSLRPETGDVSLRAVIAVGPKGDAGADGSNVLPTDTAIKNAIENPASLTAGALTATSADAIAGEEDSGLTPQEAVDGRVTEVGGNLFAGKPVIDANDLAILMRDRTVDHGVNWTTGEEVIARALGWSIATDYDVKGDYRNLPSGGAVSTGTPNFSAPVTFTIADQGKLIAIRGAGASGKTLVTTILTFVNSTHVTLAANAATTVASAEWSYASDDSAALQAWIDGTLRGRGMKGWLPPNKGYGFTVQLIVPSAAYVQGGGSDYGQRSNSPTGGTELCWFGASGTDAMVTSIDAETDWSKALISGLRLTNKADGNAAGTGLVVRNPQNTSLIFDVCISDFPDFQMDVKETKTTGTLGASPGCAFFDKVFLIGGKTQLRVKAGMQPLEFSRGSCDTTAATLTESVLVESGATPSTARSQPVLFRVWKIEIAATTPVDIVPWRLTSENLAQWDSCQAQDNRDASARSAFGLAGSISTKGVIEWTNSTKKWPRAVVNNMAARGFTYGFRALSCGFSLPNPSGSSATAGWGFSFDWTKGDLMTLTFMKDTLTASMSGVAAPIVGVAAANPSGILLPWPAVLVAMSVSHSADVSAGSLTASILKNGSTTAGTLGVSTVGDVRRRAVDLLHTDIGTGSGIVAAADQVFAAGDRITANVSTTGTFAPTAGLVLIVAYLRMHYPGD